MRDYSDSSEQIDSIRTWLKELIDKFVDEERINRLTVDSININIKDTSKISMIGIPENAGMLRIFLLAIGINLENNKG